MRIFSIGVSSLLSTVYFQTPPGAFQLLELRVVHDLVQLNRDQVIDLRDSRVDHRLSVF